MSLKDFTNKTQENIGKAKDGIGRVKDAAATAVQPHFEKIATNPHVEKIIDNVDAISGRRLEENLTEYTDVYGEVLLELHRRQEAERLQSEEKLQRMEGEIASLREAITSLQEELRQARWTR